MTLLLASTNRDKLLVIGPEPPPYTGMEIATAALVRELTRSGIAVLRVNTADPQDELGNRGRITAHNVRLGLVHLVLALRRALRRDVSAVYVPIAQELVPLLRDIAFIACGLLARKPVIVHLHGGKFASFYAGERAAVRLVIRQTVGRAALGIVLTESLRSCLECILPRDRLAVVANGVSFEVDDAHGDIRNTSVTGADCNILFLSSLAPPKGVFVFIEGFALALQRKPTLRATIAGKWSSARVRDRALRLVATTGIGDALSFTGEVVGAAKRKLMLEADIFCLPSPHPEGQPLVVLEAMAAGLPVVTTGWPGLRDTVIDGETGLLLSHKDGPTAAEVAEKLVCLAEQPALRAQMSAAGRSRYELLYTEAAFGERMAAALSPFVEAEGTEVLLAPAEGNEAS